MVRIKIYFIVHVEKFMELIEESRNNIFWLLPNGTVRDLKNDYIARQSAAHEAQKGHGVEIAVLDTKDYYGFINFMMGGC